MTNFIVHIGDGKCGSTSIQAALWDARQQLRDVGMVYETATPKSGHFNLVRLLGRPTRGDDSLQLEAATETISRLRQATRRSETGASPTVLLSAESFFTLSGDELETLLGQVDGNIGDVHLLSYVRPPTAMYLSLVQQQLKGSSNFAPPNGYCRRVDQVLERWSRHPIASTLSVRVFDRSRLVDRDVVSDYADAVRQISGFEIDGLSASTQNESITAEQLVVLQRFRRQVLAGHEGKLHPRSNRLLRLFEELNAAGCAGTLLRLKPSVVATIATNNQIVVEGLNRRFPKLDIVDPVPPGVQPEARSSADVIDLLDSKDEEVMGWLFRLVPEFSPALNYGEASDGLAALDRLIDRSGSDAAPSMIQDAVARFWQDTGCGSAAQFVRRTH